MAMKLKEFHYTMTHDEFGDGGLVNNLYILFTLMFIWALIIVAGGVGFLLAISHFL